MKKIAYILSLGIAALFLSSCCGLTGSSCGGYTAEAEVTKYKDVTRTVDSGAKGGQPYEVTEKVAYTTTETVKTPCGKCGSYYRCTTECCDVVSKEVLKRRTAQGASGEPHIGQIPTMKVLAE